MCRVNSPRDSEVSEGIQRARAKKVQAPCTAVWSTLTASWELRPTCLSWIERPQAVRRRQMSWAISAESEGLEIRSMLLGVGELEGVQGVGRLPAD